MTIILDGIPILSARLIQFDTTVAVGPHVEGRLYWDSEANTLAMMTDVPGVVLQIGQENYVKARNNTGSTIENGSSVYVTGAIGNRPTIAKAQANDITKTRPLGVTTQDIANNADGYVTTLGLVRDLNTSSFNAGDTLYLSETVAGGLTNVVPSSGYTVVIGCVIRKNPSNGSIFVEPPHGIRFGNGVSYSVFEYDGTLKFVDDATVWDDIFIGFAGARVPAANAPSWTTFIGNIGQYTFAVNDYLPLSAVEIEHSYEEGTDFELHVHYATNGVDVDDRTVKWEIEYSLANINNVFPASTVVSAEDTISAGTADRTHKYLSVATVTGTGVEMGSAIVMRVRRIASSGTEPSNDPFGLMVGVHIKKNTVGSRAILSK